MGLHNLQPALGSTKSKKRVGRGQGSGTGKTAGRGNKGQKARSGYKAKRGFEGGQMPLYKRVPKIGFTSCVNKPYVINVQKVPSVAELSEITIQSIREIHKMPKGIKSIKLIGKGASELLSKIKDENITTSKREK